MRIKSFDLLNFPTQWKVICAILIALFSFSVLADSSEPSSSSSVPSYTFTAEELSGSGVKEKPSISMSDATGFYNLSSEDRAIIEKTKLLRAEAVRPEFQNIASKTHQFSLDFKDYKKNTEEYQVARSITNNNPHIKDSQIKPYAYRNLLFVSFSMSEQAIKLAFASVSASQDTVIVFRGLTDPKNVMASVLRIHNLSRDHSPVTNVVIDPVKFRDYRVTKVPTLVRLDESKTKEIVRLSGVTDIAFFTDKLRSNPKGDLGNLGPLFDIEEMDMMEAMQNKALQINWAQKQEDAKKRFWFKQNFIDLAQASTTNRRYLDPTVNTVDDIKDPNGKILIPAGTRINPLEMRQFGQAMIIFDPRIQTQRKYITENLVRLEKLHGKVTLIATSIPREDGWSYYKNMTDSFKHHVFTLTPEIQRRFELNKTPSIVTSDKTRKVFIIDELAL